MNDAEKMASGAQNARLGLTIANGVIDAVDGHFTHVGMQELLKKESKIREIVAEVTSKILAIPIDPWTEQKKKIERFYKIVFNYTVDWSKITLPSKGEGFEILEYMLVKLTDDDIFSAYAKRFGKDAVWKTYDNIRKAIKEQQLRPDKDYVFLHCGGVEPDEKHLNKSYDDFYIDGNQYMVPKEGLLFALRYRFETGNIIDIKGVTIFNALDSDGNAMLMSYNRDGRFLVSYDDRNFSSGEGRGPRQVRF